MLRKENKEKVNRGKGKRILAKLRNVQMFKEYVFSKPRVPGRITLQGSIKLEGK